MILTVADKVDQKLSCIKHKLEDVQRKKFHEIFPDDPASLYKELSNYKVEIDALYRKSIVNKDQYTILFPVSQRTDSKRFDSTLYHVLTTNICGYLKPKTGWQNEPNANDLSNIADLIRIKKCRNFISHLSKCDKTEHICKAIYKDIKGPLLRLGCTQQDLLQLLPTPLRFKFLPSIPTFTGRESELHQIHQEMLFLKSNNYLGLVVSSLAGIGKSELAKKYFETYAENYNNNVVWINAEFLPSSFQELGSFLQLNVKNQHGNYKPDEEIIALVHSYFADDKILFIFDNADLGKNGPKNTGSQQSTTNIQNEEIFKYLPSHCGAFSLITSQNSFWPSHFKMLPLETLSYKDASTFVRKELNLNVTSSKIVTDEILKKLGRHSLALQQFVTYVKETKLPVEEYLKLLLSNQPDILPIVSKNTIASIKINIDKVIKEGTALTLHVLNALRFLNGKEIYRGFFFVSKFNPLDSVSKRLIEINKNLRLLEKYSLIRVIPSSEGNFKEDIITVHSLVQETLKHMQGRQRTEVEDFQRFLDRFPLNEKDQDFQLISKINFDEFKYWLHQFMYLHENNRDEALKRTFLRKYSKHILYLSSVTAVLMHRQISQDILENVERLLEETESQSQGVKTARSQSPDTQSEYIKTLYRFQYCKAWSLIYQGKFQESVTALEKLVKNISESLGEKNIEHLRARNFYLQLIRFAPNRPSVDSIKELWQLSQQVFGKNHGMSLVCLGTYADYHLTYGNVEEALAHHENAISEMLRFYEEPHPTLLGAKIQYAMAVAGRKKYQHALDILEGVLSESIKIYVDENHWDVVVTKNMIAHQLYTLNKNEPAKIIYKEVLLGYRKYLDHSHPIIIGVEKKIEELSQRIDSTKTNVKEVDVRQTRKSVNVIKIGIISVVLPTSMYFLFSQLGTPEITYIYNFLTFLLHRFCL